MVNYIYFVSCLLFDFIINWFGLQCLLVVLNDFWLEYLFWYVIVNMQFLCKFVGGIELYGGVKNLLDFVFDNFIFCLFDFFDQQVDDFVNNFNGYIFDVIYNYVFL